MCVFNLPDLEPILVASSLPYLSPVFNVETSQRRMGSKETLTELLVADLGRGTLLQTYLILRTAMDDIILYESFVREADSSSESWHTGLRFRKVPLTYIPKYNESLADELQLSVPLRSLQVGDFRAVCIPGSPASLILKDPTSLPKILEVRLSEAPTRATTLSPLSTSAHPNGFMVLDANSMLQEYSFPNDVWYGTGWSVRQIKLDRPDEEIRHIAYHASRGLYIVAACRYVDFYFSEDDVRHPDQDGKSDFHFKARTRRPTHHDKHHVFLLQFRSGVYW